MISSSTSIPFTHSNTGLVKSTDSPKTQTDQQKTTSSPEQLEKHAESTNSIEEIKQSEESKKGTHEHSDSDKKIIEELKSRDREVRAHESAHKAAAGGLAKGGASYSYSQGPDGQRYAIGGEVSIDTSAVSGDPQATLLKAQTIIKAALAPANPSSADRAVASSASQMAATARSEIITERKDKQDESEQSKDAVDKNEKDGDQDIPVNQQHPVENKTDRYQQINNYSLNSNPVGNNLNVNI